MLREKLGSRVTSQQYVWLVVGFRVHRDYANADPQAQQEWVATVKKIEIATTG